MFLIYLTFKTNRLILIQPRQREGDVCAGVLMMKATLDTNVIIHLYDAGLAEMLHSSFDEICVYAHIIDVELIRHGSPQTIETVRKDIASGKITVVTKDDLLEKGIWDLFDECLL